MMYCESRISGKIVVLCASLLMCVPIVADDAKSIRAVKLDPEVLAGLGLDAQEPYMDPEDVLDGNHRPRGKIPYYGEQLVVEIYEDDPATMRFDEPFIYDEFVMILSGKLILTGTDSSPQEFTAGDSFVIPKGFTGTYQMLGNYRELIVIERNAYEEEYGVAEE